MKKNLALFSVVLFCFGKNVFAQSNTQVLTLESSMNMAEKAVFDVRLATSNQEYNQQYENQLFRELLPNISFAGNYYKYDNKVNKAVGNSNVDSYGYPSETVSTAGFTLTQPIVGLVPLFFGLQAASAQTRAALHSKLQSKSDARLLGANSFINAVKAVQLLNVAESSVKVAKTQLHDGQAQFNAGKLTNADVLKFKLNLENAKTNLIQAQTTAKVTLVTLAEIIGEKNPSDISLPKQYKSILENKKPEFKNLDVYISKALIARNDILSAKAIKDSNRYKIHYWRGAYFPKVSFVANYTRNFQAKDLSIPATTTAAAFHLNKSDIQDTLYYGFQFSWALLDWGVRQAQISQAVENTNGAGIQEEQIESQTKIQVTNNFLKLQDAYQTLDSAKVSVEYAKDMFQQMEAQFINGQATTTDVLGASNDQTSAMAKFANATGDLDLAWLSLQSSIGETLTTTILN